jgi:hypothetical protein
MLHEALFLHVAFGIAALCASAQSLDLAQPHAAPCPPTPSASAPAQTTLTSGSSKAVLVPFGPYITKTGVGAGGAPVSELYTAHGYHIYGVAMQSAPQYKAAVADDFAVPAGQAWTPAEFKWLLFHVGYPTTGSTTSMRMGLWNEPIFEKTQSSAWRASAPNVLLSTAWSGVYRATDANPYVPERPITEVRCSGAWAGALAPGSYWVSATGMGTSPIDDGPWATVVVKAGQVPPTGDPWNGHLSFQDGVFRPAFDPGWPLGSLHEPFDFLFQVEGESLTEPAAFCSSKVSSLGCVPVLSGDSILVSKSGAPATTLVASPVPGGAGLPAILLYSESAPIAPIATTFGSLCLSSFARAGAFPSTPGGTPGACDGAYTWNIAALAAAAPSVEVGDALRIQAWYRDSGFPPPGNANFTNGIEPLLIEP